MSDLLIVVWTNAQITIDTCFLRRYHKQLQSGTSVIVTLKIGSAQMLSLFFLALKYIIYKYI